MSATLNFHPQGRNVYDVTNEGNNPASSPQVEWVYGSCTSWWLWGLVAPGLGRLKPDTTGSSYSGRPASDFSTFTLISNIIYIPSLGVKVQSDPTKNNFPLIRLAGG